MTTKKGKWELIREAEDIFSRLESIIDGLHDLQVDDGLTRVEEWLGQLANRAHGPNCHFIYERRVCPGKGTPQVENHL